MIATRFKDDTNALNATHVTDPNQIVEIIQKFFARFVRFKLPTL